MIRERMNVKSYLAQTMLFTLIVLAGLWLGASIPSITTSRASEALPAPTFQSPIGTPQLNIVKTVDNTNPEPGDVIEFTLTYSTTNPGSQVFDVHLYDFLPAGVQYLSSNPLASYKSGRLHFSVPSVGSTPMVATVQVRVREGYEQLRNYALLMADWVNPVDVSLLTTVSQPPASLNVTKMGDSAVLVGGELVYTLRCENPSGITVNDATVVDILPTGMQLEDASPPPDSGGTPSVLTWSLGDVGAGESRTIVITATAPSSTGRFTNTALADARQRVVTHTVFATEVVTEAAILRLSKHGSAAQVAVGDELMYTLEYENIGNQSAAGVALTDTLPSDVTVVGVSSPASATVTTQQVVWDLGTVVSGTMGTATITVTIDGDWDRTLHNVANITAVDAFPGHAELYTPIRPATLYLPTVMRTA
jgi:uncharacterized repeat protein (TIGR01451 family)